MIISFPPGPSDDIASTEGVFKFSMSSLVVSVLKCLTDDIEQTTYLFVYF